MDPLLPPGEPTQFDITTIGTRVPVDNAARHPHREEHRHGHPDQTAQLDLAVRPRPGAVRPSVRGDVTSGDAAGERASTASAALSPQWTPRSSCRPSMIG